MRIADSGKQQKLVLFTGILIYATLIFLAWYYFPERIIFTDAAFHIFYILKDCGFTIQANRFGAVFTQLFPLVSAKLHLPLNLVMINYSESFVICNALIFFLCYFITSEKAFASVMMLFSIFMITDDFYWIQSELLQGIAFTILFFAIAYRISQNPAISIISWTIILIMTVTIVFFHPLLIIVFIFFTFFLLLDSRFKSLRKLIVTSLLLAIITWVIKKYLIPVPEYDANAMATIKNFTSMFPHYFSIPSNHVFLRELFTKFYLAPFTLAAVTFFYLKHRSTKKLSLVYIFFFAYLLLINVTHDKGTFSYYMESLYIPLSIFLLVPFVFDVMPNISIKVQVAIFILIVAFRIVSIQNAHTPFTARLNWEKRFLSETADLPQRKLVIDEKDVPLDTLLFTWGTAYEFWLLSTMTKNETRSIMITDNAQSLSWALGDNKSFITKWGVFKYNELPKQYFMMHDTSNYMIYHP